METIDLSWLTREDLVRCNKELDDKEGWDVSCTDFGDAYRLTLVKELDNSDNLRKDRRFVVNLRTGGYIRVRVYTDSVGTLDYHSGIGSYPARILDIPRNAPSLEPVMKTLEDKEYEIVKTLAPEIAAVSQEILKTLRAQSKEDFYDDATDYQDDEPTDFGDASNYDEALVRRIKESLE